MPTRLSSFLLLADGTPSPGISWQLALFFFASIIALISGVARWLGARRWLAVCIPIVPLGLLFAYTVVFNVWDAGQGGAAPMWMLTGPLFIVGLITSLIVVFIVPKRHDKPSA